MAENYVDTFQKFTETQQERNNAQSLVLTYLLKENFKAQGSITVLKKRIEELLTSGIENEREKENFRNELNAEIKRETENILKEYHANQKPEYRQLTSSIVGKLQE